MKIFGKLNDKLGSVKIGQPIKGNLAKAAAKLQDYIATHGDDVFSYGYKPSNFTEFKQFNLETIQKIRHYLNTPKLTVDEYHDVRKIMRDYKVFFDLVARTGSFEGQSIESFDPLLKNLSWISKKMGDAKDDLYNDIDQGAKQNPSVVIDETIKDKIRGFMDALEKNLV